MKKGYTDITVVLDRSGSMESIKSDTIGGFNRFLSDQKKVEGEAVITLIQFDNEYEAVYRAINIKCAEELSDRTFVPRGSTALLDALGRTINSNGERFRNMPKSERPEKVVFVVITDGYENASREYSRHVINDMIKHQSEKYSWEFVYLGANQDAIAEASKYGFRCSNTLSYAGSSKGINAVFDSISTNLTAFRTCTSATMAFTDSDRKAQQEAK